MWQPYLNRRAFSRAVGLSAIGTALDLVSASTQAQSLSAKTKVTIAVAAKSDLYSLPLTIAEQLGFFRLEGLDVSIIDFPDGAQALQSVLDGNSQVVSGAFEQTIRLQSKNVLFQAFVLQGRAPQIALGISPKNLPSYKSLSDLRGKKIGVTSLGSSTHMVSRLVLAHAGVRPEDVAFVTVGMGSGALLALRSGQVDALCHTEPVMTMLEQKREIQIVADTRTLKASVDVFGGPMPAACLAAPRLFLEKYPVVAQALTHAIVHALKWLQTAGPGDIIRTIPEAYLLGDRGLYLASFDKVREAIALDGVIPEEGARTALRVLSSFESAVIPEKVDIKKTYTNEFARIAKARFKA